VPQLHRALLLRRAGLRRPSALLPGALLGLLGSRCRIAGRRGGPVSQPLRLPAAGLALGGARVGGSVHGDGLRPGGIHGIQGSHTASSMKQPHTGSMVQQHSPARAAPMLPLLRAEPLVPAGAAAWR
jgi:hypothetical protein